MAVANIHEGRVIDLFPLLLGVEPGACRRLPLVYAGFLYVRYTDDTDGEWTGPAVKDPEITFADCVDLL